MSMKPLQVEILAEGDHVNELMIVVGGLVEVVRPAESVSAGGGNGGGGLGGGKEDDSVHGGSVHEGSFGGSSYGGGMSVHLGSRWARWDLGFLESRQRPAAPDLALACVNSSLSAGSSSVNYACWWRRSILGDGEAVAEVAFFTEIVQMESVRSITVAKVPPLESFSISKAHDVGLCAVPALAHDRPLPDIASQSVHTGVVTQSRDAETESLTPAGAGYIAVALHRRLQYLPHRRAHHPGESGRAYRAGACLLLGLQHAHAAPCVAVGSAFSDVQKAKFALLPTGDPMRHCVCVVTTLRKGMRQLLLRRLRLPWGQSRHWTEPAPY